MINRLRLLKQELDYQPSQEHIPEQQTSHTKAHQSPACPSSPLPASISLKKASELMNSMEFTSFLPVAGKIVNKGNQQPLCGQVVELIGIREQHSGITLTTAPFVMKTRTNHKGEFFLALRLNNRLPAPQADIHVATLRVQGQSQPISAKIYPLHKVLPHLPKLFPQKDLLYILRLLGIIHKGENMKANLLTHLALKKIQLEIRSTSMPVAKEVQRTFSKPTNS